VVTYVVAALAGVGHVDGQHQGLVAQRLHALDDLLRQLAVAVHVQLEPAEAVGRRRHDLLHGAGGVGAGDVAGVDRLRGWRDMTFVDISSAFNEVQLRLFISEVG